MSTALTEEQKVVHLLNRTSFGPTREAVQKVNRDLNLTTDFRTVCSEVISGTWDRRISPRSFRASARLLHPSG